MAIYTHQMGGLFCWRNSHNSGLCCLIQPIAREAIARRWAGLNQHRPGGGATEMPERPLMAVWEGVMAALSTKKPLTSMPLNSHCKASTWSCGLKLGQNIPLSGNFILTLQNLEHKAFFLSGGHLKLFKGRSLAMWQAHGYLSESQ